MEKERLHYIDVIKGILILIVVFGHTSWQADTCGVTNNVFKIAEYSGYLYYPFYMAAFFAVTGFCSNFDKPYKQFLWSDIKMLLFPSVSLCVVAAVIRYCMMGEWDFSWVAPDRILRFCSLHWFLPALFWAKQIHYFLHNLNTYLVFGSYIVLSFVGFKLYSYVQEYWWFNHGLMFVIYLQFGAVLKKRDIKYGWLFGLLYLVYVVIMKRISGYVPYIASETHLRLFEMPLFIMSSFLGIVGGFYISMKINANSFLEYCGRNSIVIYCLHFTLMNDFYRSFTDSINSMNIYQSVFALILMYGMILVICAFVVWMLKFRCTRWILGKW